MGLAGSAFKDVGKEFPKGTILFKEGDEGKEMFLINSGEVKLSRKTSQGDVVLAKLGFGEFFGEMSVITNEPRTVTAESITDCRLNVITKDVLETLGLVGYRLSKHELSAFFRKPGHKHFRECKDQVLRNFLKGLQLKFRDE